MERLADQLVNDAGPVVLGGVDVVDSAVDSGPQYTQRLVPVSRRPEHVVAGELHGAVSDPVHPPPAEGERPRRFDRPDRSRSRSTLARSTGRPAAWSVPDPGYAHQP